LEGGGKRIRPVLLLHAASLFTDQLQNIYPAAVAIELFHNFTLLHDDIMDHAGIRRGVPSVHVKFGENSAILSGDAMSIMAFRFLSKCDSSRLTPLLSLFATTALEVCEGQQYDMEFEEKDEVSVSEYLEMIRLKTAVLIACSLEMGALLAGAGEEECKLLYRFGIQIGIAFQLQDDWLDVYGDEKTFGKKIGGDICENKKTFLLLKALELSDATDRMRLLEWISNPTFVPEQKIEAVREIFTRSGASAEAKNLMQFHYNQAMETLNQLLIAESEKSELRVFAEQVMDRVK
jgi:geranylgeranyl diphosphate synthase type II